MYVIVSIDPRVTIGEYRSAIGHGLQTIVKYPT